MILTSTAWNQRAFIGGQSLGYLLRASPYRRLILWSPPCCCKNGPLASPEVAEPSFDFEVDGLVLPQGVNESTAAERYDFSGLVGGVVEVIASVRRSSRPAAGVLLSQLEE